MIFIKKYIPLLFFLIISLLSIFLFFFGPIYYKIANLLELSTYLILIHVIIIYGFCIGLKLKIITKKFTNSIRNKFIVIMNFFIFINLSLNIALFLTYGFNPINGLNSAGEAREIWQMKSGSLISYLTNWTEIFIVPLIGMGIMRWVYLSKTTRLIIIATVIFQVILSVSIGARHWLFIILFLTVYSLIYGRVSGVFKFRIRKFILYITLSAMPILFLFTIVTLARSGVSYDLNNNNLSIEEVSVERYALLNLGKFNDDHIIIKSTPGFLQPILIQGISYFTHGYYGLSLCLSKPFNGIGFGLGQSSFGNRLAEKLFGKKYIEEVSYPLRIALEDNYPTTNWITTYPWLASDFTFLGTFIYFFLLSVIFGNSWKRYLFDHDFHAAIVVTLLSMIFLQIPLIFGLQDPANFTVFYFFVGTYFLKMLTKFFPN